MTTKFFKTGFVFGAALLLCPVMATAGFGVVPKEQPARIFCGANSTLTVWITNSTSELVVANAALRLSQTGSEVAVRLGDWPWKKIEVLPGQTIVESATLAFPPVKTETLFVIQFFTEIGKIFGSLEVVAYPTNLLENLRQPVANASIGVYDPNDELKPLLQALSINYTDLKADGSDTFAGSLAILGPFQSEIQAGSLMRESAHGLAKRGVAVLWLQPPRATNKRLHPSFYILRNLPGTIVIAENEIVAGLSSRPEAQLNLTRLAALASQPAVLSLTDDP